MSGIRDENPIDKKVCHKSLSSHYPYYCYSGYPAMGDTKGKYKCMAWLTQEERCSDL
jgi:hypothetical protein